MTLQDYDIVLEFSKEGQNIYAGNAVREMIAVLLESNKSVLIKTSYFDENTLLLTVPVDLDSALQKET